MKTKILLTLTLLSVALHAQVNGKFAAVDATQGYTVGGAAPNNFILCGNGTRAVFAASCGTAAQPFYQTMSQNSANLPQRFRLDFTADFSLIDQGDSTLVRLATTIGSNTSGNAATATNAGHATNADNATTASNASAVGGVPLSGLCQTGGTGCPATGVTGSLSQMVGSRSLGTTFTNTHSTAIFVSGYVTTGGDHTSAVSCDVNGIRVWSAQYNATVTNGPDGFMCMVPAGATYLVTAGIDGGSLSLTSWAEFVF